MLFKLIRYLLENRAPNGKGAYWLSESEEIKNPYYGEVMLTCGETKEVIQ